MNKLFLLYITLNDEGDNSPVGLAMLMKAATRSDGIHTLYNLEHIAIQQRCCVYISILGRPKV
jgi:hypothetical protein